MSQSRNKTPLFPMLLPTRRDIRFHPPAERIADWHTAGGPIVTAFFNTFSIVLPVGERFFIDSVRAYRDEITDPELKKAITAFIGQEAMHGREHEEFNAPFFARTPVAPKFERFVEGVLSRLTKHFPKYVGLSGTIALEHFTALLADALLRDPRVMEGAEPQYAALWKWHALEETEHKAVAFDTWETVMGRGPKAYFLRGLGLVLATVIFWGLVLPVFMQVLRTEGKLGDVKAWRQFYRYNFGEIGLLRVQLRNYLDYFRPGFHPWDHDNRGYLQQIDDFLAEQQKLAA